MRRAACLDRSPGGLTLVELVASLGILATALALFALAEATARQSVVQQAALLDAQAELAVITRHLRADLPGASAIEVGADAGGSGLVSIVVRLPGQSAAGDPLPELTDSIVYETTRTAQGVQLVRQVVTANGSSRAADYQVLSRRIADFAVTADSGLATARIAVRPSEKLAGPRRPLELELTLPRRPWVGGAR